MNLWGNKTTLELREGFFWLNATWDGCLAEIYAVFIGVRQASHCEGFGLSLIEGEHLGLPIIARKITVFREMEANHAHSFDGKNSSDLSAAVEDWLLQYEKQEHIA